MAYSIWSRAGLDDTRYRINGDVGHANVYDAGRPRNINDVRGYRNGVLNERASQTRVNEHQSHVLPMPEKE